jgi:tetratricopeptide (TPR) repeat protein
MAAASRAYQLDPLSPSVAFNVGYAQFLAGFPDDAITTCGKIVQDNPSYARSHWCLLYAYWAKRNYTKVVDEWKLYAQYLGSPTETEFANSLAEGFQAGGWKSAMQKGIEARLSERKSGYASPFEIAVFYTELGNKDQAFIWLDTAYRERGFQMESLKTFFALGPLRSRLVLLRRSTVRRCGNSASDDAAGTRLAPRCNSSRGIMFQSDGCRAASTSLYPLPSSPTYTHMRSDLVLPALSIGIIVSSVATTCDCRTRSAINSYKGSIRSATSPRQIDCLAREISIRAGAIPSTRNRLFPLVLSPRCSQSFQSAGTARQLQAPSDGLVTSCEPGAIVPVEVLVEQDKVTPVLVFLKLRGEGPVVSWHN